ncbi:MAG: hypothetical protein AAF567_25195 [Actinomycetota bacterium]
MADDEAPIDEAGVARERFEDSFDALRKRSNESASLDRDAIDFETLTADHLELVAARSEATAAKRGIVSRYEPPTPDYVEQPLGRQDTSTFGRIAAIVTAIAMAAAIPVGWFVYVSGRPDVTATVVSSDVSVFERPSDQVCRLTMTVAFADAAVLYTSPRLRAVIDGQPRRFVPVGPTPAVTASGEPRSVEYFVNLLSVEPPCPTADEINLRRLTATLVRVGDRELVEIGVAD